ncbi:hypothetical protein [Marinobacter salarius]|nr:hypothetical protein [Marinobacter salarius]CUR45426.1 hypothetical protein BN2364_0985 [Alloalcanivorax xenomutans]
MMGRPGRVSRLRRMGFDRRGSSGDRTGGIFFIGQIPPVIR